MRRQRASRIAAAVVKGRRVKVCGRRVAGQSAKRARRATCPLSGCGARPPRRRRSRRWTSTRRVRHPLDPHSTVERWRSSALPSHRPKEITSSGSSRFRSTYARLNCSGHSSGSQARRHSSNVPGFKRRTVNRTSIAASLRDPVSAGTMPRASRAKILLRAAQSVKTAPARGGVRASRKRPPPEPQPPTRAPKRPTLRGLAAFRVTAALNGVTPSSARQKPARAAG